MFRNFRHRSLPQLLGEFRRREALDKLWRLDYRRQLLELRAPLLLVAFVGKVEKSERITPCDSGTLHRTPLPSFSMKPSISRPWSSRWKSRSIKSRARVAAVSASPARTRRLAASASAAVLRVASRRLLSPAGFASSATLATSNPVSSSLSAAGLLISAFSPPHRPPPLFPRSRA